MFLTLRCSKLQQFIHFTIHSLVLGLTPAAEGCRSQICLWQPVFKDTPFNYKHTHQTSAGTPVILLAHFSYLQRTLGEPPQGILCEILSLGENLQNPGDPQPQTGSAGSTHTTATPKSCQKLLSLAMYLQDRRFFHPHLDAENQNQHCSQLLAQSLRRTETWVLHPYCKPILSFLFIYPFNPSCSVNLWSFLPPPYPHSLMWTDNRIPQEDSFPWKFSQG